jgi:hypothetical protein
MALQSQDPSRSFSILFKVGWSPIAPWARLACVGEGKPGAWAWGQQHAFGGAGRFHTSLVRGCEEAGVCRRQERLAFTHPACATIYATMRMAGSASSAGTVKTMGCSRITHFGPGPGSPDGWVDCSAHAHTNTDSPANKGSGGIRPRTPTLPTLRTYAWRRCSPSSSSSSSVPCGSNPPGKGRPG